MRFPKLLLVWILLLAGFLRASQCAAQSPFAFSCSTFPSNESETDLIARFGAETQSARPFLAGEPRANTTKERSYSLKPVTPALRFSGQIGPRNTNLHGSG